MRYNEVMNLLFDKLKLNLEHRDDKFIVDMNNIGKDPSQFIYWEWQQGIGIFGLYKLYTVTNKEDYLQYILNWYKKRISDGLPDKNVNTTTPMLTLALLYEREPKSKWRELIIDWAFWIENNMPRTDENGLQHMTSDCTNHRELWDDTLMMAVLFLAKAGVLFNNQKWIDDAIYQFLIHTKYLCNNQTGLWYHGWTFDGRHNFANALWARGNCWVTIAIPELLEILGDRISASEFDFFVNTFKIQCEALKKYQSVNGLWHTLINDDTSYLESSGSAGLAYGILKGLHHGYLDNNFDSCCHSAVKAILNCVDSSGEVANVSSGTPMGPNLDFYKNIPTKSMPYGQSLILLLISELMKF